VVAAVLQAQYGRRSIDFHHPPSELAPVLSYQQESLTGWLGDSHDGKCDSLQTTQEMPIQSTTSKMFSPQLRIVFSYALPSARPRRELSTRANITGLEISSGSWYDLLNIVQDYTTQALVAKFFING
jgi:hypothetical protein